MAIKLQPSYSRGKTAKRKSMIDLYIKDVLKSGTLPIEFAGHPLIEQVIINKRNLQPLTR